MKNIFKRSLSLILTGLMVVVMVTACQSNADGYSLQNKIANNGSAGLEWSALDSSAQQGSELVSILRPSPAAAALDVQLSRRGRNYSSLSPDSVSSATVYDAAVTEAADDEEDENSTEAAENDTQAIGAEAALADEQLDVSEMLKYALEDEYLARDEYIQIMDKFGEIRPFSNIKKAEDTHIKLLTPLFAKYELELPEYTAAGGEYPGTLQEAYTTGVEAEIKNIDMYERFLEQDDLPADIVDAFEKLMKASEKHLAAFKRKA